MVSRFAEASSTLGDQAQRMRELVGFFSIGSNESPESRVESRRGDQAA